MGKKDLSELELFKLKKKRNLIIFSFVFTLAVILALLLAFVVADYEQRINIDMPYRIYFQNFEASMQWGQEITDEDVIKKITRGLKGLTINEITDLHDYYNDYGRGFMVYLIFEDELGYDRTESYYFTGKYLNISTDDSNKTYTVKANKKSEDLMALLKKTYRQRERPGWVQH